MELNELKEFLKNLPLKINSDDGKRKEKAIKDFKFFLQTYFMHHINENSTDFNDISKFRNFVYKK